MKKPAFFAYAFLNEMGKWELTNDDKDSWVCWNEEGIQTLVWDYTKPEQKESNDRYFKRDLPSMDVDQVCLNITGVPEGKYEVRIFKVGYSSNDVYADYQKIGSPDTLKRAEVVELAKKNSGAPVLTMELDIETNGLFSYTFNMKENDVFLIKLTRQQ